MRAWRHPGQARVCTGVQRSAKGGIHALRSETQENHRSHVVLDNKKLVGTLRKRATCLHKEKGHPLKSGLFRPLLWVRSMARITPGGNFIRMMHVTSVLCQWIERNYITRVINSLHRPKA